MLLDGEEIVVEDVIADSPAFLAGLQSGDVIIGINGDFSGNIQRYRSMIQDSEKPVKLLIRRNGTLSDVSFRPISIL
jgi:C-terminal processing protease CtpA/Prc